MSDPHVKTLTSEANEYARLFDRVAKSEGIDLPVHIIAELMALFATALSPSQPDPSPAPPAEAARPQMCLVCGFDGDESFKPRDYGICACCGTEFGFDDRARTHSQLRAAWIDGGCAWFDPGEPKPAAWSPGQQLLRAGFLAALSAEAARLDLDQIQQEYDEGYAKAYKHLPELIAEVRRLRTDGQSAEAARPLDREAQDSWRNVQQRITDRCPSCGYQTLFIGSGGYLTCSWLKCPDPGIGDALDAIRAQRRAALSAGDAPQPSEREKRLETALRDLLGVISADDLIPESVSYMRQARSALAAAVSPRPAPQQEVTVRAWKLQEDSLRRLNARVPAPAPPEPPTHGIRDRAVACLKAHAKRPNEEIRAYTYLDALEMMESFALSEIARRGSAPAVSADRQQEKQHEKATDTEAATVGAARVAGADSPESLDRSRAGDAAEGSGRLRVSRDARSGAEESPELPKVAVSADRAPLEQLIAKWLGLSGRSLELSHHGNEWLIMSTTFAACAADLEAALVRLSGQEGPDA